METLSLAPPPLSLSFSLSCFLHHNVNDFRMNVRQFAAHRCHLYVSVSLWMRHMSDALANVGSEKFFLFGSWNGRVTSTL